MAYPKTKTGERITALPLCGVSEESLRDRDTNFFLRRVTNEADGAASVIATCFGSIATSRTTLRGSGSRTRTNAVYRRLLTRTSNRRRSRCTSTSRHCDICGRDHFRDGDERADSRCSERRSNKRSTIHKTYLLSWSSSRETSSPGSRHSTSRLRQPSSSKRHPTPSYHARQPCASAWSRPKTS